MAPGSSPRQSHHVHGGTRRGAFSLSELVVAIGVLVLMLSLAGQVFNFTIKSTGQATAVVEINQRLRAFEKALRDDLRHVRPGQSVLLIHANPVAAYWTGDGREADPDRGNQDDGGPANGYPHVSDPEREDQSRLDAEGRPIPVLPRADILTMFVARGANSFVHPGYSASVQQVVYGHAEQGEYQPNPQGDAPKYVFVGSTENPVDLRPYFPVNQQGEPSAVNISEIPAARWHLSRRAVLLTPGEAPPVVDPPAACSKSAVDRIDHSCLLESATDMIGDRSVGGSVIPLNYDNLVLQPPLQILPGIDELASESSESRSRFRDWQLPRLYLGGAKLDARSRVDVTPPAAYASRLASYMLPHCASFKVEWALNPRSNFVAGRLDGVNEILWIDPGHQVDPAKPDPTKDDPLIAFEDEITRLNRVGTTEAGAIARNLESLLCDPQLRQDGRCQPSMHADGRRYSLAERFRSNAQDPEGFAPLGPDDRANVVAFVANRRHLNEPESLAPDDIFPGALRVTVDVYDPQERLERPIRHVIVIPIGE